MKVTCAWCQRDGRPANLGERDPLDDPTETHSICRRHLLEQVRGLASHSFPGVKLLLVVRPGESALYERLRREFGGVRGVKVILERRRGERRRAQQSVPREERSDERRIRRGALSARGYIKIRFGRA